jgi:hypothetical protein
VTNLDVFRSSPALCHAVAPKPDLGLRGGVSRLGQGERQYSLTAPHEHSEKVTGRLIVAIASAMRWYSVKCVRTHSQEISVTCGLTCNWSCLYYGLVGS